MEFHELTALVRRDISLKKGEHAKYAKFSNTRGQKIGRRFSVDLFLHAGKYHSFAWKGKIALTIRFARFRTQKYGRVGGFFMEINPTPPLYWIEPSWNADFAIIGSRLDYLSAIWQERERKKRERERKRMVFNLPRL